MAVSDDLNTFHRTSFHLRLILFGVLAVVLTLCHLNHIRLLLLLSDVMVRAEICPFGWAYYPGTDSCFYTSTFVADQNTAMSECRGMGADLPSIDNRDEMRFLLGIS